MKLLLRPPAGEGGVLHDEELTTLVHAIGGAATNRVPLEVTLAALAEEKNDSRLADVAQQLASQLDAARPQSIKSWQDWIVSFRPTSSGCCEPA